MEPRPKARIDNSGKKR